MTHEELIRNARFTIFLGKNGSGKSTLLRAIDSSNQFDTKYISPERGGILQNDPNIENNMAHNQNWMVQDRRKNRSENFRQQTFVQFKNLELLILREIDKNRNSPESVEKVLSQINDLLPAIAIRPAEPGFKIYTKGGTVIGQDQISSGEAELIALAIEVLVFSRKSGNENNKTRLLLLDEPDVHLHPDLQQKFIRFVENIADKRDFKIVVATHSTAIISAFAKRKELQIVPITSQNQRDFQFFKYDEICQEILPIFGAHPLSSEFNRSPVLLVEGEDDKRVVDQFVRSSNGKVLLSPCDVGSVDKMNQWENWLNNFLPSIYDNPKGFSLRDLDTSPQCDINDVGCVSRTRLNCYAIENLLLSEECLRRHGYEAAQFQKVLSDWVAANPSHPAHRTLKMISEGFDGRRTVNIKDARNVVVALLGSEKPWEVIVGQLLAENIASSSESKHSVREYLGENVRIKLLGEDGSGQTKEPVSSGL